MTGANAKIKRILVRQNGQEKQVRPGTITETYTVPTSSTRLAIGKSGYKIKQVVMKLAGTGPSSGYNTTLFMKLYDKNPNTQTISYDVGGSLLFGSDWGLNSYGKFYSDNPSTNNYLLFPSSATSATQGAYMITINNDGTCNVKVGKVYGTWLYDNNITLSSSQLANILGVFNSADTVVSKNVGTATSSVTKYEITVTYTPN